MNKDEQNRWRESEKRSDSGMKLEHQYSAEVDTASLLRVMWRRKFAIAAATLITTVAATVYAFSATQWYRAETVLMPRESGPSGGLSGQLAQLGGLASIAGITLSQTSKQEPLGVLRSVGFAKRFVEQHDLETSLSEQFNLGPALGADIPDQRIQRAVDRFRKSIFTTAEDKKTGLVTVAIYWKDPVVASHWANAIARQLNEEIRERALNESTRNIQFLQGELERTKVVSLQQAIARLVESEMQKLMLAQGTDEYAFRVIDDAQPPFKRSRPKRAVLVLVAFLGGLFASALLAILIDPFKALLHEVNAG
jgi:uncharacterized protein involved in exopolysaccharide biosynthesis